MKEDFIRVSGLWFALLLYMILRSALFIFLSLSLFSFGDSPKDSLLSKSEKIWGDFNKLPRFYGVNANLGMTPELSSLKQLQNERSLGIIGKPMGGVILVKGSLPAPEIKLQLPGSEKELSASENNYNAFIAKLLQLRKSIYLETERLQNEDSKSEAFKNAVQSIKIYKNIHLALMENAYKLAYHSFNTHDLNRALIEDIRTYRLQMNPSFAHQYIASLNGEGAGKSTMEVSSRKTEEGMIAELSILRNDEMDLELSVLHAKMIQAINVSVDSGIGLVFTDPIKWVLGNDGKAAGKIYRDYLKFLAMRRELINRWAQRRLVQGGDSIKDLPIENYKEQFYSFDFGRGVSESLNYKELFAGDRLNDFSATVPESMTSSLQKIVFFNEEDIFGYLNAFIESQKDKGYLKYDNLITLNPKEFSKKTFEIFKNEMNSKQSLCSKEVMKNSRISNALILSNSFPGDEIYGNKYENERNEKLMLQLYNDQRNSLSCALISSISNEVRKSLNAQINKMKVGAAMMEESINTLNSDKSILSLKDSILLGVDLYLKTKIEKVRPIQKVVSEKSKDIPVIQKSPLIHSESKVALKMSDFLNRHERMAKQAMPALVVKNQLSQFLEGFNDEARQEGITESKVGRISKNDLPAYKLYLDSVDPSNRPSSKEYFLVNADLLLEKQKLIPRDPVEFQKLFESKVIMIMNGLVSPNGSKKGESSRGAYEFISRFSEIDSEIKSFFTKVQEKYSIWLEKASKTECNPTMSSKECQSILLEKGISELNLAIIPAAIETYKEAKATTAVISTQNSIDQIQKVDKALYKKQEVKVPYATGQLLLSEEQKKNIKNQAKSDIQNKLIVLEEFYAFLGIWQEFKITFSKEGMKDLSKDSRADLGDGFWSCYDSNEYVVKRKIDGEIKECRPLLLAESGSDRNWRQIETYRFEQFRKVFRAQSQSGESVSTLGRKTLPITGKYWILSRAANSVLDQMILANAQIEAAKISSPFLEFKDIADSAGVSKGMLDAIKNYFFNTDLESNTQNLLEKLAKDYNAEKNEWNTDIKKVIQNAVYRSIEISDKRLERFTLADTSIHEYNNDDNPHNFKECFEMMRPTRISMELLGENMVVLDREISKTLRSDSEIVIEEVVPALFNAMMLVTVGGAVAGGLRVGATVAAEAGSAIVGESATALSFTFERSSFLKMVSLFSRSSIRQGLSRTASAEIFGTKIPNSLQSVVKASGGVLKTMGRGVRSVGGMFTEGGFNFINIGFLSLGGIGKYYSEMIYESPQQFDSFNQATSLKLALQNANAQLLMDDAVYHDLVNHYEDAIEEIANGSFKAKSEKLKEGYNEKVFEHNSYVVMSLMQFVNFKKVLGISVKNDWLKLAEENLDAEGKAFMKSLFTKTASELIKEKGVVKGTFSFTSTFGNKLLNAVFNVDNIKAYSESLGKFKGTLMAVMSASGNLDPFKKLSAEELFILNDYLKDILGKTLQKEDSLELLMNIFARLGGAAVTEKQSILELTAAIFKRESNAFSKMDDVLTSHFRVKLVEYSKEYGENFARDLTESLQIFNKDRMNKVSQKFRNGIKDLSDNEGVFEDMGEALLQSFLRDLSLKDSIKHDLFRVHIPKEYFQNFEGGKDELSKRYALAIMHAELIEVRAITRQLELLEENALNILKRGGPVEGKLGIDQFMKGLTAQQIEIFFKLMTLNTPEFSATRNSIVDAAKIWKRLKVTVPGLEGIFASEQIPQFTFKKTGGSTFEMVVSDSFSKEAQQNMRDPNIIDLDLYWRNEFEKKYGVVKE